MKKMMTLLVITFFGLTSCVQKIEEQKVTLQLDVSGQKNIEKVGVRGQGNPLDWEKDLPMIEIIKDTLYEVTFISKTGRLCNELKFNINGKFELENQDNRKIYFDKSKKTFYKAKFNVK